MGRFFITGGMGFVGSYVVRGLLESGHEVMIFDSFLQYVPPEGADPQANPYRRLEDVAGEIEIVRGNITSLNALRQALHDFRPEYVIHLASMPLANLAIESPEEAFESITRGTNNLLQLLGTLDSLKRYCYISSSMVYGDFRYGPVDEDHPKEPKEVYGALKYCAEIMSGSFCRLYGVDHCVVRPTAVYGPHDANKRVLATFLSRALAGKPLPVRGRDVALDFTYVRDTAQGIILAVQKARPDCRIFNISRGEGRTLGEAAELIASMIPGTEIEYRDEDRRYPRRGALDITRAREVLGFSPRYSLEEGLEEYLEFLRSSPR